MNVVISTNTAEVQKSTNMELNREVLKLQTELDDLFYNKISTPEQVIIAYKKMQKYKLISGSEYTKTIKENTIV